MDVSVAGVVDEEYDVLVAVGDAEHDAPLPVGEHATVVGFEGDGRGGQGAVAGRWRHRGPAFDRGDPPDRSVGAFVVVVVDELVDPGLQFGDVGGVTADAALLVAQPFLHRLLEPFDLAAGLRVERLRGDRLHAGGAQVDLEADLDAAELAGEVEPVVVSWPLGTPQRAVASLKVSQVASVVTVTHARQRSATRLWSSSNDRIST